MVGTRDHTIFSGIRIDFTQPFPSAFFSELTAATHAFRKAAPHVLIRSDCKSGISTVLKAARGKLPRGPQGALIKCIRKKLTPPQLSWIESHPEKRKRLGEFDDGDCGIYFADRIAGKEYTAAELGSRSLLNTTVIDGDHLLQDLFLANRFSICHLDAPTSACLRRIEDVVQTVRAIAYKRKRDVLRSPRLAIWEVVPHEWAASMYDLGASATVMSRATCVRILWDKHMHGGNLGKNPLFTDDNSCPLCGGADSQYHIIRECSLCHDSYLHVSSIYICI